MKVFIWSRVFFQLWLILFLSLAVQAVQGKDSVEPEDLLVSYTEKNTQIRASDSAITIKIYQSGQVLVAMPEIMRMSGYYQTRLMPEEIDALWVLLTDEKILTFDTQRIREVLNKERRLSGTSGKVITSVSDKAEIHMEYYPNRYSPPGLAGSDGNVAKHITWSGLRWDAEQFSHIESIRLLSEIQQFMLSILNRDNLQSVDP